VEPTLLANILKFGELGLLALVLYGGFKLAQPIAMAAIAWFENQIQLNHRMFETNIEGFARLTVLMESLHYEVKEHITYLQKENGR